MDSSLGAAIDLVEASYDLEVPPAEWLPSLLRAGGPLLDRGMGCYGILSSGMSEQGVPIVTQVAASDGDDLAMQVIEAAHEAGPELVARASRSVRGKVSLLSEAAEQWPQVYEVITRHAGCQDLLSVTAVDPDDCGVDISVASPERITLDRAERALFEMLEVHLAAGCRLRRGLGHEGSVEGVPLTDLPLHADALVDPQRFLVADAVGEARHMDASISLRNAARRVDRARGPLRSDNPQEALRLWEGLVRGRWSLVDWFDSDGRRFILAKRNAPRVTDPRGLSAREAQVATYAAAGESSKKIGYRLGLSPSYVSRLLRTAMRKLGVKTQAQLVEKMRATQPLTPAA